MKKEVVDGSEEEEKQSRKRKWRPEKFRCEKCGKMVAATWKRRHSALGYCRPKLEEGELDPSDDEGSQDPGSMENVESRDYTVTMSIVHLGSVKCFPGSYYFSILLAWAA